MAVTCRFVDRNAFADDGELVVVSEFVLEDGHPLPREGELVRLEEDPGISWLIEGVHWSFEDPTGASIVYMVSRDPRKGPLR